MNLLELSKCHEASPGFKRHLEAFEVSERTSRGLIKVFIFPRNVMLGGN